MLVYIDVNCLIYFVEGNPQWWPIVTTKILALRAAGYRLAVSDLSRAECLVGPLRTGDSTILASYQAFFTDPEIQVLPLTAGACERAAALRATLGLKLPDALHLATAIEHSCSMFLTNDNQLRRCTDITVDLLV